LPRGDVGHGDFMDPFLICMSAYATRGTLSPIHLMLQSHNNNSLIERMLKGIFFNELKILHAWISYHATSLMGAKIVKEAKGSNVKVIFQRLHMTSDIHIMVYNSKLYNFHT